MDVAGQRGRSGRQEIAVKSPPARGLQQEVADKRLPARGDQEEATKERPLEGGLQRGKRALTRDES